jgi:hypothetical protein
LTLPALLIYYHYYYNHHFYFTYVLLETKCCPKSLAATGIRGLLRNFTLSSRFSITRSKSPSARFVSVANLVFKDVDILTKAWRHKNRFCANLWLIWTYHQSTYNPRTSFFLLCIYCCYICVVLSVWYCLIEYLCYILLCFSFTLALKYEYVLFKLTNN